MQLSWLLQLLQHRSVVRTGQVLENPPSEDDDGQCGRIKSHFFCLVSGKVGAWRRIRTAKG